MKTEFLKTYGINNSKITKLNNKNIIRFTSFPKDEFVKSPTVSEYKYRAGEYYREYPLGSDNGYTLYYETNIEKDSKGCDKMPYPPSRAVFNKPLAIAQAADVCNKHYNNCIDYSPYNPEQFNILKEFAQNTPEFQNEKVVSIMDVFANTIVMELEGNRVLKMVKNNPFPNRLFDPDIDIPLLSDVYKFKGYYILIQEKAETEDISCEDVSDVIDRIKEKGYEPYDIEGFTGDMQIGRSPSLKKMMLIDSECARGID